MVRRRRPGRLGFGGRAAGLVRRRAGGGVRQRAARNRRQVEAEAAGGGVDTV
uniref:Uncharacterized protein n=1 Tax=Arundo donax TaxID=35708 RepID=A0A0A8YAQ8_ARUDO